MQDGFCSLRRFFVWLAGLSLAVLVMAPQALAVPPTLPTIEFPIDTASIGTAVVTAGGAILVIVFGVMIGFSLIKKLARRLKGAV